MINRLGAFFITLLFMVYISHIAQAAGDNTIKAFEKKVHHLCRSVKTELKYQSKINRLLGKRKDPGAEMSADDSLRIYKNSEVYRQVDSIKRVYSYFTDTTGSGVTKMNKCLEGLELQAGRLAVVKYMNDQWLSSRKDYSSRLLKKAEKYRQRAEYMTGLLPDIPFKDIIPPGHLASLFPQQDMMPRLSMQDLASAEDLEKMGFQLRTKVAEGVGSQSDMGQVFEQNLHDNLTEYLPENYGQYADDARTLKDVWTDIRRGADAEKPSYSMKPFSHRLSYGLNTNFRKTNDNNGSLLNVEANMYYHLSDYFYVGAGMVYEVHASPDVRKLKLKHNNLMASGSAGASIRDFYAQLIFQKPLLKMPSAESLILNEDQLFIGLGRRFRAGKNYYYNVYWGYDLLWKNYHNVSPFVIKFGFVRAS